MRKPPFSKKMQMVSLHMTEEMIMGLDELVQKGIFPNRSEVIRVAVATYLASLWCPKAEKEKEEAEDGLPVTKAEKEQEEEEEGLYILRGR